MSELLIWMNGAWVGTWRVGRTGKHSLGYAPSWQASARSRPLSLSLPFTSDNRVEGEGVRNCFDNLLPDSEGIRKRISARFRTKKTDAFTLLQAGAETNIPSKGRPFQVCATALNDSFC